jgi:hypothetical protein
MVTKEEYKALREGAARRVMDKLEEIADIVKGLREEVGGRAMEAKDVSLMIDLNTGQKTVSAYKYHEEKDRRSEYLIDSNMIDGRFYPDGIANITKFIGEEE